jgi:hypothetical protein
MNDFGKCSLNANESREFSAIPSVAAHTSDTLEIDPGSLGEYVTVETLNNEDSTPVTKGTHIENKQITR